MFLAEATTATTGSSFTGFDVFVILFTILIFIGVIRLITAPQKKQICHWFRSD